MVDGEVRGGDITQGMGSLLGGAYHSENGAGAWEGHNITSRGPAGAGMAPLPPPHPRMCKARGGLGPHPMLWIMRFSSWGPICTMSSDRIWPRHSSRLMVSSTEEGEMV